MNKTKFSIISVLLAFIMLVSCFAVLSTNSKNANALSEDYSGEKETIYYFADSYFPVYDRYNLEAAYPNNKIVYDIWENIDSETLQELIDGDYFNGFGPHCIIILELKYNLIDSIVLEQLLKILNEQGCIIWFISSYDESYYDFNIYDYVSSFTLSTSYSNFYHFIYCCVKDMVQEYCLDSNACIFFDYRLLDITINDLDEINSASQLCEHSPVLRLFLMLLCEELSLTYTDEYDDIFEELNSRSIVIFVFMEDNIFIDISSDTNEFKTYGFDEYDAMLSVFNKNYKFDIYFVISIWKFSGNFYDFFKAFQDDENYSVIIYLWEVDTITYGSNGIVAKTYNEMAGEYPPDPLYP